MIKWLFILSTLLISCSKSVDTNNSLNNPLLQATSGRTIQLSVHIYPVTQTFGTITLHTYSANMYSSQQLPLIYTVTMNITDGSVNYVVGLTMQAGITQQTVSTGVIAKDTDITSRIVKVTCSDSTYKFVY